MSTTTLRRPYSLGNNGVLSSEIMKETYDYLKYTSLSKKHLKYLFRLNS